jgi:putative Mg2+ transporter-C (MgtC) family protein
LELVHDATMIVDWWAWLGQGTWLGPGEIALRLGAAIALSCLIGLDRELKDKPLGLRTNMLVALGAASFCLIMIELLHMSAPGPNARPIDAGRVLEGIIGGIGFLGAGASIRDRNRVFGARPRAPASGWSARSAWPAALASTFRRSW